MEHLPAYFRSLSDPTRLRIVNLLMERELCGCELQHVLRVPQSNVSRHLGYLRNSGLVVSRRQGPRVAYAVAPSLAQEVFLSLRRILRNDDSLRRERTRLSAVLRSQRCRRNAGPAPGRRSA